MSGQLADAEEAVLKSAAAEAVIAAEEKKLAATKSDLRHAEERLVKAVAARKEGEARIAELEAQLARYGVSSSGDESVRIQFLLEQQQRAPRAASAECLVETLLLSCSVARLWCDYLSDPIVGSCRRMSVPTQPQPTTADSLTARCFAIPRIRLRRSGRRCWRR